MQTRVIKNEQEMMTFAEEIFSVLPQKNTAHVIALSGDLGAGKTSFTKALAKHIGIIEHITSPTFVVMKKYSVLGNKKISSFVHIDAYRVEDIDEMIVIGLDDLYNQKDSIICIEWSEKIKELIPENVLHINIVANDNGSRTVIYGTE